MGKGGSSEQLEVAMQSEGRCSWQEEGQRQRYGGQTGLSTGRLGSARGVKFGGPTWGEGLEECQGGTVVTRRYQAHHPAPCPQSFAEETLRTLCLAYKEVDEDMYEEWRQRHQEASILLQNRAHALHQVYEEMEQGLQVRRARRAGAPASPLLPGSRVPTQSASCPLPPPPAAGSHGH